MRTILFFVILLVAAACKDWEYPQNFPVVFTDEVVNINSQGAEFGGRIESLGVNQKILSYGFVWNTSGRATLDDPHVIMTDGPHVGPYTSVIRSSMIVGTVYLVRAFVQTENLMVYGNEVRFTSAGSSSPAITNFSPTEGWDGDEITIKGENFSSSLTGNVVNVGPLLCTVKTASSNQLTVILPTNNLIGDYKITVTSAEQTAESAGSYSILGPRIRAMSKNTGRVGDLITLQGEYFSSSGFSLYFGEPDYWVNREARYIINSSSELQCYVSDRSPGSVNPMLFAQTASGEEKKFVYTNPFTIVDSWEKVDEAMPIKQYLPSIGIYYYSSVLIGQTLYLITGKSLYAYDILTNKWWQKTDFPGDFRFHGSAFTYDGQLYYGFGEGQWPNGGSNWKLYNDIWHYDPGTDKWELFTMAPLEARFNMVSFVIGNKAYMGFGFIREPGTKYFTDFWVMDFASKSFTQIPNAFTGTNSDPTYFVAREKGYVIGPAVTGNPHTVARVWEFDPASSSWTQKGDAPLLDGIGVSKDDRGLVVAPPKVYEYDPANDRWIARQSMPGGVGITQFAQYRDGILYCGFGNMMKLSF